jgi:hypothetical protein
MVRDLVRTTVTGSYYFCIGPIKSSFKDDAFERDIVQLNRLHLYKNTYLPPALRGINPLKLVAKPPFA